MVPDPRCEVRHGQREGEEDRRGARQNPREDPLAAVERILGAFAENQKDGNGKEEAPRHVSELQIPQAVRLPSYRLKGRGKRSDYSLQDLVRYRLPCGLAGQDIGAGLEGADRNEDKYGKDSAK